MRSTKTRSVALFLSLALVVGVLLSGTWRSASAVPFPGTDDFVKNWTAEWMANEWSYTRAEALDMAREHDLIVAFPETLKDHAWAMKSANPKLTLLIYVNATFSWDKYPDYLWARNKWGGRVEPVDWGGTYMLNLNDTRWWDEVANSCAHHKQVGFDGCLLDVLDSGALWPGYLKTQPVNSWTGQLWTDEEWITKTTQIAQHVRNRLPGSIVIGNALGSGVRYYNPQKDPKSLVGPLHGAMAEMFIRDPRASVDATRGEANWKKGVDMMIDVQRRGTSFFAMTKLWTSAPELEKNRWHEFALATFMLASDGSSFFAFYRSEDPGDIVGRHPIDEIEIGTPTGSYFKWGSVYRRDFTGGMTLVNPTNDSVYVELPSRHRTWWGNTLDGIWLGPNMGRVLAES